MLITLAWILGIAGLIFVQGLRRIPASPPHKGQRTWLGKRLPGQFVDEGWGFFLGFPYLMGFIMVKVERVTFTFVSEKTRTPDRAESRIPVFLTIRPVDGLLSNYIDSGQEAGVRGQLEGKVMERLREWVMGPEEGPQTWVELNQAHLEAVSVLVKKIAGNSLTPIPPFAQPVPTWIWLRYYAQPRPTQFLKNEEVWAKRNWARVRKVLAEIKRDHGPTAIVNLKTAVESRRLEIDDLRTGAGKIILADLGVRLERLNIGDINVLGEVGEQAENEAKEVQERQAEILELEHVNHRLQALMDARPVGPGLTREQALEMVQLSLKQTTKAIDAKTLAFDPATANLIAAILGGRRP